MIAPSIVDKLPPELGDPSDTLLQIVDGVYDSTSRELDRAHLVIAAWEVEAPTDDRHVPVALVLEAHWTEAAVALYRAAYADPTVRKAIPGEELAVIDGLDATDRDAYFARMVGARRAQLVVVAVEVGRVGGAWKVTDYAIDGHSARLELIPRLGQLALEAQRRYGEGAAAATAATPATAKPDGKKPLAYWLGYALLPAAGLIGFVVWLRRSDERARRARRARNAR